MVLVLSLVMSSRLLICDSRIWVLCEMILRYWWWELLLGVVVSSCFIGVVMSVSGVCRLWLIVVKNWFLVWVSFLFVLYRLVSLVLVFLS